MKRSKRKETLVFNRIKTPYMLDESDTLQTVFERYTKDTNAVFETEDHIYYKIIECYHFKTKISTILVALDIKMDLKLSDKLIDENGKIYNIKGFEMIRISTENFPDWYSKLCFVSLDGDPYSIGDYLARLPRTKNIDLQTP